MTTTGAIHLTKHDARRFVLAKQRLWPPRALAGEDGIRHVFDALGCVQYDPLNVVGRNPDLVLQSRVRDYRPAALGELAYGDRWLFDYWDKMAALVPMRDWPHFAPRREAMRRHHEAFRAQHEGEVAAVLAALETDGPMCTLDFTAEHGVDGRADWRWGNQRTAKAVLEMLWDTGEIMVSRREGARRFYDLWQRIVPADVAAVTVDTDPETYLRWRLARRLRAVGFVGPAMGGMVWAGVGQARDRSRAVEAMARDGELVPVTIEGDRRTYHMLPSDLERVALIRDAAPPPKVAFIAALDSLMWSREMVERLFGFEYRWEVYKPAAERQYGYYVLPVLYGDRLVARFEPRMRRKDGVLEILSWYWEDGASLSTEMAAALEEALTDFCRTLGADRIETADGRVDPAVRSVCDVAPA